MAAAALNGHRWLILCVGAAWSILFGLGAYNLWAASDAQVRLGRLEATCMTKSDYYRERLEARP